jgi:predicted nucleic acid-binding Zn ribbon protein
MSFYVTRGSRVFAPSAGNVKISAYSRGRTCAAEGCATILSTYNPSAYCSVHEPQDLVRRHRQRMSRPLEERACPQCGEVFETANPRRRFCSDRCRVAAFQQRRQRAAVSTEG